MCVRDQKCLSNIWPSVCFVQFNELHVKMTRLMQEMQANLGSQEDISKRQQMNLGRVAEIEQMLQSSQMHHHHHHHHPHVSCY